MSTFSRMIRCDGRTDRLSYQRNVALLAIAKAALDLITMTLVPGLAAGHIAMAWLDPFVLIEPWLAGSMPVITCLGTMAFFSGLVWNSVHRTRDAGLPTWLGLLTALPFVGLPLAVLFALLPAKKHTVWDLLD